MIVGKRVICDIADSATVDIPASGRLKVGVDSFGATHPGIHKSKLSIDEDGVFRVTSGTARLGPCSVVHVEGEFSMGSSYINSHSRVLCGDEIRIGDGCAIAWNTELLDDDCHNLRVDGQTRSRSAPIVLEDNVWVGHDVTIKKGVTIGEGAVIGSNTVVTDDIPANSLAVGNPAQVVYDDVEWW